MKQVLAAIFLAAPLFAADFEITKVIEVGHSDLVPLFRPLKWSPNGSMLAYFSHGHLMVADTLGNGRKVIKMTYLPHRFEWLSDREIVVMLLGQTEAKRSFRIQMFDIVSGHDSIIAETEVSRFSFLPTQEYDGPFSTVEGNLYFVGRFGQIERIGAIKSRYSQEYIPEFLEKDHIVRWGENGLYSIRANLKDSLRIGPKPYKYLPHTPIVSFDGNYVADGGTLLRLRDSSFIVIDTILSHYRDSLRGCGITFTQFVRTRPEVVFEIGCDDGHRMLGTCIAVFNYETGELSILDSVLGIPNAETPTCSPDGSMIAFVANNKAYILKRGGI